MNVGVLTLYKIYYIILTVINVMSNERVTQTVLYTSIQVFYVVTICHTAHIKSIAEFFPNVEQCVFSNC